MDLTRLLSVLLSVLLVASTVSIAAPVAAAAGPPGLDRVPAENVGPPDHANAPDHAGPPTDVGPPGDLPTEASAWGVRASDHAADLTVEVGTTDGGELALRLGDARNHAGREVAVDAETLTEAVGHRPTVARGLHESGDRWSSSIRYVDGLAVLDVPRFSENVVTFESTISVEAAPAEDGDTFRYNVSDADSVENLSVTLTGRDHEVGENVSATLANGESVAYDVDGTAAPRDASVTLTGVAEAEGGDSLWSEDAVEGGGGVIDAVYQDGRLYWITGSYVEAYDVETRSLLWSRHTENYGSTQALTALTGSTAADGRIFIGTAGGRVAAVLPDGTEGNAHIRHSGSVTGLSYNESTGYVTSGGDSGDVVVFDSGAGSVETETTAATNVNDLAEGGGTWYAATDTLGVDAAGAWRYDGYTEAESVAYADGVVYASGDSDGTVTALDAADGSPLWSHSEHVSGEVSDLTVVDGVLYSAGSEELVAYDVATETVLWSHALQSANGGPAGVDAADGVAYSVGFSETSENSRRVLAYTEELYTTDPAVSIGGTEVLSVSGELGAGETVTENVSLAADETGDVAVSTAEGTRADVSLSWTEVTESVDPAVDVNGHTVSYDGTLADGETASLDVLDGWVESGENVVTVEASPLADGPPGLVGLSYSHAAVEERAVNYSAGAWSESYAVSKVYAGDVEDATLSVPWASERVTSIRSVTVTVDGTEVDPVGYGTTNGTLAVDLGSVEGGSEVSIEAVGSKVRVVDGAIRVLNATAPGSSLDTEVEVLDRGEGFGIGVEGTTDGHLLHYTTGESWSGASSTAVLDTSGGQTLETDAPAGGTFRVRTAPVEVRPEGDVGAIEATVHDPDPEAPRFYVGAHNGSDAVDTFEVAYHGAESGETWELLDAENHRTIQTAEASSPVWFTAAVEGLTYTFRLDESAPSAGDGAAVVAASGGGGDGLDLTPTAVLLGTAVSVLGILFVGRRFGVTGRRGTLGLAGAGLVVGVVGVEAVTHGSVVALTVEALLSPVSGFAAPGAGTVVLGVAVLLGLAVLHSRFGLPTWFLLLAGAAVGVWILDAVTGGALGSGLSEVSPLIWILVVSGTLYLLYTRLKPRDIVLGGR